MPRITDQGIPSGEHLIPANAVNRCNEFETAASNQLVDVNSIHLYILQIKYNHIFKVLLSNRIYP